LATHWLSLIPIDQVPSAFNFWDKAQHALGFAALALTGLLSYPNHLGRLLLGLVLLGVGIEYAQHLSGWRQGDLADWLADCVGVALGSLTWNVAQWKGKIQH
jgi:VanZ family protein